MRISVRETEAGVSIFILTGDLDAPGAALLRGDIDRLLDAGGRRLIIDCTGVGYASSAGIGTLVHLHRRVRESGGRLLITGTDGHVFEVLSLMNLGSILELNADTADALTALGQTPDT